MAKLTLYKGITFVYSRVALDADNAPIDLTGKGVEFVIKESPDDADPGLLEASIGNGITIADQTASPGGYTVRIEPSVTDTLLTGNRYFDVVIIDGVSRYVDVERQRLQILNPVNHLGGSPAPLPIASSRFGHYVKKASAGTLAAGVPVYPVGSSGGYVLVEAASAGVTPDAIGIMSVPCTQADGGYAAAIGEVPANTTGMSIGGRVYLGVGAVTATSGTQELGIVLSVGASGAIAVNIGQALPSSGVGTISGVVAGAGLVGGGVTGSVTLNIGAHADGSIVVSADTVGVGVLATDAQHGVRGGGTQHALATEAVPGFFDSADKLKLNRLIADWAAANTRYFFIDPTAGNDTRVGYIDAAHGNIWADSVAGDAVSLKTYEEFLLRVASVGRDRRLVCLIKGNAAASTPINLFKKDGTTLDDIDLSWCQAYKVAIVRASDFTNSINDRTDHAGYRPTAGAGPNGDGSWTVVSYAAPVLTVAGTAVNTGTTMVGMKLRFAGNVTLGLRTRVSGVKAGLANNQFEITIPGGNVLPAAGDTFFLEAPSVRGRTIVGHHDMMNLRKIFALDGNYGPQMLGLEFQPSSGMTNIEIGNAVLKFCRFDLANVTGLSLGAGGKAWQWQSAWIDEGLNVREYAHGVLYTATTTTKNVEHVFGAAGLYGSNYMAFVFSVVRVSCNGFVGAGGLLLSSAVHEQVILQSCDGDARSICFVGGTGTTSRLLARGLSGNGVPCIELRASRLKLGYVQVGPYGTDGVLLGDGSSFGSLVNVTGAPEAGYGITHVTRGSSFGNRVGGVYIESGTTLTGPAGDIAMNGPSGAIVVTHAQVQAEGFSDSQGNYTIGAAGGAMRKVVPGTLMRTTPIAADATGVVDGDLWPLTDGRIGTSVGGTKKWFWPSATINIGAEWSLATTRYYAVDYVGGSDTNVGYSDVSMAAAGAVAVKTLTQLMAILPTNGAGRAAVIAIKGPTANTASAISYFKADGTTLDSLDLRGKGSYKLLLVRTTQDFTNSANDQIICAPVLGQVGPNGDSSFTVAGGATINTFSISAGALTAKPGLYGMRVRFTGNVTAALANQCRNIWKNTTGQIILGREATVAPVAGDTFFIERAGVQIDNVFLGMQGSGGGGTSASGNNSPAAVRSYLVGLRCNQTTFAQDFIHDRSLNVGFCFFEFDNRLSVGDVGNLVATEQYINESNTGVIAGSGLRLTLNTGTIINGSAGTFNMYCSAIFAGAATNAITRRMSSAIIGMGSYSSASLQLQSGINPAGGHGITIGNLADTRYQRLYLDNANIQPGNNNGVELRGLDINNCAGKALIKFQSIVHGTLQLWDDIVSTDGGNTDVVIDVGGYQKNTLLIGVREGNVTATATLGGIRTFDGTIISLATVSADLYEDTGGNVYVGGTTARRLTRRTPGIIHNVPRLSADPTSPLAGDVWARDDARLGALLDGTNKYAWFTRYPYVADWDPTLCRYFLVDYDGGSDSNVGFVDATVGSTIAPAGLAIKTLEKLRQILPKFGNNLKCVVLIKPRASFATYLKQDGTTADSLDLRGILGYDILLPRGSSDLTNSAADRVNVGFMNAYAGPGASSEFTVGVGSTTSNIVVASALPAENTVGISTITGFRVRWLTGALAGTCCMVYSNDTGNIVPGANLASAPVAGATFVIERPGVVVNAFFDSTYTRSTQRAGVFLVRAYAIGIAVSQASSGAIVVGNSVGVAGCEMLSSSGSLFNQLASDTLSLGNTYVDEAGTTRDVGIGLRSAGSSSTGIGGRLSIDASTFLSTTARQFLTSQRLGVGGAVGCYFGIGPTIAGQMPPAGAANSANGGLSSFGSGTSTTVRPTRVAGNVGFDCALDIRCSISVRGVLIQQSPTAMIRIRGTGLSVNIDNVSGSSGNTDYVLNLDEAWNCYVTVGQMAANTASASLGDITTTAGGVATFAQLAYLGWVDSRANKIVGTAQAEASQGVLCTASGAVALGDNVRVSASGTVTKAQADSSANATDVTGCVQNAAANGASCMVVPIGVGLMRFNATPTAPNTAYLSEATAGEAKTTAPATSGTNQKLRVGKVIRPIAGQPYAVAMINPEYVPVLA